MIAVKVERGKADAMHRRNHIRANSNVSPFCWCRRNGQEGSVIYRRGWVPVLYRSELENKLKEQGFGNWQQISRFLCEGDAKAYIDYDLWPEQYAYQVVDNVEWQGKRDAKFWQRLNRLWFVPLWFLTIPFQWLLRGRVGFSTTSKIAKLCQRITGLE